jgi:SAM-dependent methyltransferase
LSAIYDSLAVGYGAARHRRFYARVVSELVGMAGSVDRRGRGRGLDLACGVGASTGVLRRAWPAIDWTGLDCSRGMLARFRARRELQDVPAIAAAAEKLPFAERSLDLVACSFALHWMESTVLGEIARVLAAGGKLLLAAPLRTPAPRLSGNRLLAGALLRERRLVRAAARAGSSLDELRVGLTGWRIHRVRTATFVERYASPDDLLAVLGTRGALAALFGPHAAAAGERLGRDAARAPIGFGWPVALVVASRPEGVAPKMQHLSAGGRCGEHAQPTIATNHTSERPRL